MTRLKTVPPDGTLAAPPVAKTVSQAWPDADDEPPVVAWTAQQAQQWRHGKSALSVRRLFVWQAVAGMVVAVLAWLVTANSAAGWSAAYGALCVLLPAALFARGVLRPAPLGVAVMGFFVWEGVKLALTFAMLAAAPKLLVGLVWPALLVGLVVTMKTSWVALMCRPKSDI